MKFNVLHFAGLLRNIKYLSSIGFYGHFWVSTSQQEERKIWEEEEKRRGVNYWNHLLILIVTTNFISELIELTDSVNIKFLERNAKKNDQVIITSILKN